jgi:ABC-type uncharacterized transport system ATPase subunit
MDPADAGRSPTRVGSLRGGAAHSRPLSDPIEERPVVIEMRGICKQFGRVAANHEVDFVLLLGEIHALLGENGAGKTTLMNILIGLYAPDRGQITVRGRPCRVDSPRTAMEHGIGMVHQHFMLVPPLTVAENMVLGLKTRASPFLRLGDVERDVETLSGQFGLAVNPRRRVESLAAGEQQRVEILRLLYRGARILILDEPTAVLTPQESQELFGMLRKMTRQGYSVVLITHKLEEAIAWSDRVSVLRDGRLVGSTSTENVTREQVVLMMVGREVETQLQRGPRRAGEMALELHEAAARFPDRPTCLEGVSLEVHRGEIVGVAGVAGNGQSELAAVATGLLSLTSGTICIRGTQVTESAPGQFMRLGVAYIPEDRRRTGLLLDMSVAENLILKVHHQLPFSRLGIMQPKRIAAMAGDLLERFDIRAPSTRVRVGSLSGGNQQKVVVARELGQRPALIVAAEPTRGLDVGATESVRKLLLQAKQDGSGVLLISSELEEVLELSDRIVVMFEGRIVYQCPGEGADVRCIGTAMAGSEVAA